MNDNNSILRSLPSIDKLLSCKKTEDLCEKFGRNLVLNAARTATDKAREIIITTGETIAIDEILHEIEANCNKLSNLSLKPVINATGIILHTNLGRAPIGREVASEVTDILAGYSNLEFNLETGKRGHRNSHLSELISHVTGAEDAVVVNNAAAAMVLVLGTLAKNREVITSRGELIEIGGSFRIPEIISTSGAVLKEVGTTNKTRLSDYEKAISEQTALILKTHTSNYKVQGFTEEASLTELVELARSQNMPLVYDLGSGLIKRYNNSAFASEPVVGDVLKKGVDLVVFSGDKLLGGAQAGIIAGKKDIIKLLSKAPLMRALRVCKITIAVLSNVFKRYMLEADGIPVHQMLQTDIHTLKIRAEKLCLLLNQKGVSAKTIKGTVRCGGGTMPDLEMESYAVKLTQSSKGDKKVFESLFNDMMKLEKPIIAILRKGELMFETLTVNDTDLEYIAHCVGSFLGQQK